MRQWCVNPKFLCDDHLLGEHSEHHTMVECVRRGKIGKFIHHCPRYQVDIERIEPRHRELVWEMEQRGMNHKSPLTFEAPFPMGDVFSEEYNLRVLRERCDDCAERQRIYA